MSLRTRFIAIFLLLSILPLALVGYLSYDSGRDAVELNNLDRLAATTLYKEEELARWLDTSTHFLGSLAQRPLIREYSALLVNLEPDGARYRAAAHKLLDDHLAPNAPLGGFVELSIVSAADGRVLVSTVSGQQGASWLDEPWYLRGREGLYIGRVRHAGSSPAGGDEPAMRIATPVHPLARQPAPDAVAVLVGSIDLTEMSEIVGRSGGFSESEESYLVNDQQRLLTTPPLSEGYSVEGSVDSQGILTCLAGNSGVDYYDDYRGVPVLGAYRWIEERGWCILTEVDRAEALASVVELRNTMAGLGVLVAGAVAVLGFVTGRAITQPLQRLVRGAQEIGRGNLEHRLGLGGRDEIGHLATEFDDMAGSLHRARAATARGRRLLLALGQAAQAVQRAHTPQDVYRTVGDELANLGYRAVVIDLVDGGRSLSLAHLNVPPEALAAAKEIAGVVAQGYHFPLEPDSVYERALAAEDSTFVADMTGPLAEALPPAARSQVERLLPLLDLGPAVYSRLEAGDEVAGLLMVSGPGLTEEAMTAINAFARQASIALENARLWQETRRAAAHAQVRAEIAEALAGAGLEQQAMLEAVAQHLARALGDTCVIRLVSGDGEWLEPAALAHEDPEALAFMRDLLMSEPQRMSEGMGGGVARSGRPLLLPVVSEAEVMASTKPEFRPYLDRFGIHSVLLVPLIVRDEVIGTLGVSRDRPGRPYTLEEQALLQDVADRAALFVQNARLYAETRAWADELEKRVAERTSELNRARIAALNMMEDAEEARREAERVNRDLEREIAQRRCTQAELARSNRDLEQFAYVASHDLQEPLRAISGYLQLLQRRNAGQLDGDANLFVDRSVAATERMKVMINALLSFSRVQSRGGSLKPTDLAVLLDEVQVELEVAIAESGATVSCNRLPTVRADPIQLRHLFQNLLANALKFRGEEPLRVHVGAEFLPAGEDGQGAGWRISVSDNGIGIDPQHFERVFLIFQRLHTQAEYPGTGIGLALCKKIVERHGGRIWVESQPGQGATFFFTLPDLDSKAIQSLEEKI